MRAEEVFAAKTLKISVAEVEYRYMECSTGRSKEMLT
jgi:hypothetical protein